MKLADETIDGLIFGMALAASPKVTASREAYYAKLAAFRKATADKTKADMISELKADHPAYILELLETRSESEIRDRYVNTFSPRS